MGLQSIPWQSESIHRKIDSYFQGRGPTYLPRVSENASAISAEGLRAVLESEAVNVGTPPEYLGWFGPLGFAELVNVPEIPIWA